MGRRSLSCATLPVNVILSVIALPRVVSPLRRVVPVTVNAPPNVVNPVPVVIAWLFVVLRERVPVVESMSPVAPANNNVVPLMVAFPPSVVSPVPVVIA